MDALSERAVTARVGDGAIEAGKMRKRLMQDMEMDQVFDTAKRRLLVAKGDSRMVAASDGVEVQVYRQESDVIGKRITDLKMELLKRNQMLLEARKLQEEEERRKREEQRKKLEEEQRKKQQELHRQKELQQQQQAAAAAAANQRSKEEHKSSQETKTSSSPPPQNGEEKTVKDIILEAVNRRKRAMDRLKDVEAFSKQFKKKVNGTRMMIQMAGETVKALKVGYEGNRRNDGAGLFLTNLQKAKPELLPAGMHVIAESIIKFGGTNTAPDSIKNGETKFALVYMAVVLSINFPEFYEVFMEVMCYMCPYAVPGLREAIVKENTDADRDTLRTLLGYNASESNADYVSRMQAYVGFLAGFYQTSVEMLADPPFSMVPQGSKHPCKPGGIVEAWRWVATMLNRPPSRWTPYLVQAFLAVAGFELCRHCGVHMKKILRLLISDDFVNKCKETGEFDVSKEDNDVDRMKAYQQFFESAQKDQFPTPGKDGQDARQLILHVADNNS